MKKLLISGFEPFGGESINPSWEVVKALPDVVGGYTLTKICLPVVFGKATQTLIQAAQAIVPDCILSIGQAGGRGAVTPEYAGINLRHASIPDNAGNQPTDEAIVPDGENAYFTSLPVRKMAETMAAAGIPAQVSYSAGTYVCNELLYSLLHRYKGTSTRVGFIHIPYIPEQQTSPALPLAQVIQALTLAILTLEG